MVYQGQLPANNHIFYIAKLKKNGKKAELRYSVNKDYEKEQTEKGIKEQIVADVKKNLNDNQKN